MLLILLLTTLPIDTALRESVDVIECNHFFCVDDGKYMFSQLLFRDWNEHEERFDIRAWRMLKPGPVKQRTPEPFESEIVEASNGKLPDALVECSPNSMLPTYSHETKLWVCQFHDLNVDRVITSPILKTTWTTYDPEVTERTLLPKENRRELLRPSGKGR